MFWPIETDQNIFYRTQSSLPFYMLTVSKFQWEMSYTKYQERITILSCIYFTSIVLQMEKKLLLFNPRPTYWVHKLQSTASFIWATLTDETET